MGSKTCKILQQVKNEHHLAKLTRNQKRLAQIETSDCAECDITT